MRRRGRSVYTPLDRGYVYCRDNWHKQVFHIDCRGGRAQQVFEDLCQSFERAGWELGNRSFDSRIIRRNGISWMIQIIGSLESSGGHSSGNYSGKDREIR